MSGYTFAWLFWIAMFATIEAAAIINRQPNDTLSEHIWRWAATRTKPTGWQVRRFALLAALAWLSTHLLTGWV